MIETRLLSGRQLDYAVAESSYCQLTMLIIQYPKYSKYYPPFSPSTDWNIGGPIIEEHGISIIRCKSGWEAKYILDNTYCHSVHGDTPLIAAMRCLALKHFGEHVNIPEFN